MAAVSLAVQPLGAYTDPAVGIGGAHKHVEDGEPDAELVAIGPPYSHIASTPAGGPLTAVRRKEKVVSDSGGGFS